MLKKALRNCLGVVLFFVLTGGVSFAANPAETDALVRDSINSAHETFSNMDWRVVRQLAEEQNRCPSLEPLNAWLKSSMSQMSDFEKQRLLNKLYDISDMCGCSNI